MTAQEAHAIAEQAQDDEFIKQIELAEHKFQTVLHQIAHWATRGYFAIDYNFTSNDTPAFQIAIKNLLIERNYRATLHKNLETQNNMLRISWQHKVKETK